MAHSLFLRALSLLAVLAALTLADILWRNAPAMIVPLKDMALLPGMIIVLATLAIAALLLLELLDFVRHCWAPRG